MKIEGHQLLICGVRVCSFIVTKKPLLYKYLCNKYSVFQPKNPSVIPRGGTVTDNNNCVIPFTVVKLDIFQDSCTMKIS